MEKMLAGLYVKLAKRNKEQVWQFKSLHVPC